MKVITPLQELHILRKNLPEPVGFIPTMGFLHAGHLSLVNAAKACCATVVASIFVNPTQFGANEDLSKYPRDLEHDLTLLEAGGVDLVWTPTSDDLYPLGYQTWVDVQELTTRLEGEFRPGHFRGVTTILAKLFNAITPDRAYFGQKDAQQVAVIKRMTMDLGYPIEINVCPTVREIDGLAMSSRNIYLDPNERRAATILFRALRTAETAYRNGERDAESLRRTLRTVVSSEPSARLQYVSCSDYYTLEELITVSGKSILMMAVILGNTRLIDNVVIGDQLEIQKDEA